MKWHVAQQRVGELRVRARCGPEPPPPLKPVGGAREDLKQRPLGHPLLERLLQDERARVAVLAPSALERRHAGRLVDHKVGVLGVAGVDRGGLTGELGAQRVGERFRGGGQPGLGAELAQQLRAVLPRE